MFCETRHIVFLAEWFVFFPDNPAVAAILFIIVLHVITHHLLIVPDVVI